MKSMAEGSNLPSSVVFPSCSSKSVTVMGQSLIMGQAAVLACQPMISQPISVKAENANFWGLATLNRGQTMLKTLSGPSCIPLSTSCCDLQRATATYSWQRIRPIFFLVWTWLFYFMHFGRLFRTKIKNQMKKLLPLQMKYWNFCVFVTEKWEVVIKLHRCWLSGSFELLQHNIRLHRFEGGGRCCLCPKLLMVHSAVPVLVNGRNLWWTKPVLCTETY